MSIYVEVGKSNNKKDAEIELEKALKKFKKKVKKANLMMEIYQRQQFTKPSIIKREKRIKAKIRNKYRTLEENRL